MDVEEILSQSFVVLFYDAATVQGCLPAVDEG
jgi:hypothetical protein